MEAINEWKEGGSRGLLLMEHGFEERKSPRGRQESEQ